MTRRAVFFEFNLWRAASAVISTSVKMLISFIIVSWNTREKTCACIDSILKFMPGHEIIVVDNDSSDDSCETIRQQFPVVKLIENGDNRGFGAANNQGTTIASGDVLCFINSDTELVDGAFTSLAENVLTSSEIGAIGPKILRGDGAFEFSYGRYPGYWSLLLRFGFEFFLPVKSLFDPYEKYWLRKFKISGNVDWVSGCCLLIRKGLFDDVGGWDERFFAYYEDVDICQRIKHTGKMILYDPTAMICHHHSSSFSLKDWPFRIQISLHSSCIFLFGSGESRDALRFKRRIARCWRAMLLLSLPCDFIFRIRVKRNVIRTLLTNA